MQLATEEKFKKSKDLANKKKDVVIGSTDECQNPL